MQLSTHFSFEELTSTSHSSLLVRNRLSAKSYEQTLAVLANYILEPARLCLNTPLKVTSGFRYGPLNKAVGGKQNSQHLLGQAADIVPVNMPLRAAFDKLCACGFINYGQLIYEGKWIHISLGAPYRPLYKCRQILEIL